MSNILVFLIVLVFSILAHAAAFFIGWTIHAWVHKPKEKHYGIVRPCPACGSRKAKFVNAAYGHGVMCKKCGFYILKSYMCEFTLAINQWNALSTYERPLIRTTPPNEIPGQ